MSVGEHPHIGLQTVTWLVEGEAEHRDSLGSVQRLRPGQLNWMTAGHGIAHDELSPDGPRRTHGVQMWVALPDAVRDGPPAFEHHPALPRHATGGVEVTILAGTLFDETSPASTPAPMVGAELWAPDGGALGLPLEPEFEHALFVIEGSCVVEGMTLERGALLYLGTRRSGLRVESRPGARTMVIGGAPFGEPVLMWWNFVAREADEIEQARADWEAGRRFAPIPDHDGHRVPAPALVNSPRE